MCVYRWYWNFLHPDIGIGISPKNRSTIEQYLYDWVLILGVCCVCPWANIWTGKYINITLLSWNKILDIVISRYISLVWFLKAAAHFLNLPDCACSGTWLNPPSHCSHFTDDCLLQEILLCCYYENSHPYSIVTISISRYLVKNILKITS